MHETIPAIFFWREGLFSLVIYRKNDFFTISAKIRIVSRNYTSLRKYDGSNFYSLNINNLIFNSLSLSHYIIVEAVSTTYIKRVYAIFSGKANSKHVYCQSWEKSMCKWSRKEKGKIISFTLQFEYHKIRCEPPLHNRT